MKNRVDLRRKEELLKYGRVVITWVGIPIFVGPLVYDIQAFPRQVGVYIGRLGFIPFALLCAYAFRKRLIHRNPAYPLGLCVYYICGYLGYLIHLSGVVSSPYYVGLVEPLLALVVAPLSTLEFVLIFVPVYLPLFVFSLRYGFGVDANPMLNFVNCSSLGVLIFGLFLVNQRTRRSLYLNIVKQEDDLRNSQETVVRLEDLAATATQVCHDIRSPIGALQFVQKGNNHLPEDHRALLQHSVDRIKEIADSLLIQNRAYLQKQGSLLGQMSYRELEGVLRDLIREKEAEFRERGKVAFRIQVGDYAQPEFKVNKMVSLSSAEFKRAISNLLNNAVEAIPEAGQVLVHLLLVDDENLQIRIRDTGKGIPPEMIQKLGYRGATFGKAGGSGLGLFHAKKTIESFGGKVKIESDLGDGTTIVLTLPIHHCK